MNCSVCEKKITGKIRRGMCDSCYRRARRQGFQGPPEKTRVPKHGTASEYNRHRCRCVECTIAVSAAKDRNVQNNRRKIAEGTWEGKHGTLYSARSLGCKCDVCVAFYRERNRKEWRERTLRGKAEPVTIGHWQEVKHDGYGVTVVHWPAGDWTCSDCGLHPTNEVRSTTQQRNAA